ncbi:MAG: bifunctional folylpolyglutamate synthase/dihydrofolate synthase [Bacteroidetes bacterium]|nr:bifunctional folylpolyglutamate synthase/dihydrofolate synthase [Bacteroidota bacterium]MBK9670736.1 bifunctional folylpolyglutamate synthase/dihydrofolate synthase [Bacteroidota bacterium]MBK9799909.1 bifunctional folylpolyglutamate synthase/dihydrofolate synthase [Bacteroidota bacterium]
MNYKQTLEYLYSSLPMFQRIGAAAYKADLNNTIALLKLVRNPEKKFKSIHIAGTNGKGSVSHMLASILQCAGYRVGLYTSPHLKDFRERIKVNGKPISQQDVVQFVEQYKNGFEKIKPSFFEITVGMAFEYFEKQQVDIAVIETGLGGRLDSTNVIKPLLSVITNISFDHEALLGTTLEKIAIEKAGIIKLKTPVVVGEMQAESRFIFSKYAIQNKAELFFADQIYKVQNASIKGTVNPSQEMDITRTGKVFLEKLSIPLLGHYQQKNCCTVLQAVELLQQQSFVVTEKDIKLGMAKVIEQTNFQGRWQVLNRKPLVIADTAHNEAGIKEVMKQLKLTPHKKLHIVLGVVNDKDLSKILHLFPSKALYYFCKADLPRALDAKILQEKAKEYSLKGKVYSSVNEALKAAEKAATKEDLVFVGGSTFTVAEVL